MKRIAKITVALLLAVAMCFSLAGCYDEDLNWSAKYDDTELPAGAYIYYLSIAYNEAASKVSTEDEVLKSEIDGTPAETWIKNRADEYVNQYFYIQNEMKRLGLEMTDEDYSTCLQTTENYWNYFGTSFEKFGIAKTSFDIAYSQYNRMYLKVFNALYGEGGENEVPESELRQHIEDDYYDYEYFSAPLTKTDDDNKSVDLTDEEKADLKETLEKYKTKIESGAMTVNDAATDYALKVQQDSTYQTGIKDENGMQSSYMPDAFISAIKEMNEGDVEVVESTKYMIVLHRLPIKDDENTLLESSDNRSQLLLELKNTEYADAVSAAAQSFEGVEWNQKVLNRYKPSMFADATKNGTSSVASESGDESASSEESSAESSETSSETSETSSESSAE